MIKITKEDFNLEEEFKKIHSQKNGAYSFFLGTVRQEMNDNIDGIFLECYKDLAYSQLNKIKEDSIKKWNLSDCTIIHRISDPKLKEEFREFGDAPFLKELRRLMMFADDNLACDEFVIHKSKGLKLDKTRFAGLSKLCDGDPYSVGNRNDEYWLIDPVQSFEVIETEPYKSTQ